MNSSTNNNIEKKLCPWSSVYNLNVSPDIKPKEAWLTLTDSDMQWLRNNGEMKKILEETIILSPETEPKSIYLIVDGVAVVLAENGFTTTLNKGCIGGELSYFSGRRPMARVVALPLSTLFELSIEKLRSKSEDDPAFSVRFLAILNSFAVHRLQSHLDANLGHSEKYIPSAEVREKFCEFFLKLDSSKND